MGDQTPNPLLARMPVFLDARQRRPQRGVPRAPQERRKDPDDIHCQVAAEPRLVNRPAVQIRRDAAAVTFIRSYRRTCGATSRARPTGKSAATTWTENATVTHGLQTHRLSLTPFCLETDWELILTPMIGVLDRPRRVAGLTYCCGPAGGGGSAVDSCLGPSPSAIRDIELTFPLASSFCSA